MDIFETLTNINRVYMAGLQQGREPLELHRDAMDVKQAQQDEEKARVETQIWEDLRSGASSLLADEVRDLVRSECDWVQTVASNMADEAEIGRKTKQDLRDIIYEVIQDNPEEWTR